MKQHTAQDVAQALGHVFSHFGFPQESLSDQGCDFMSALTQIFLTDFGINQIRTSLYHPQTNGACERFNARLPKSFQIRGTPLYRGFCSITAKCRWIAYTRCSSFDLLFGRSVASPLSLLKSAWLRKTDLQGAKQNVVEFILVTRERLRHALDLATDHASKERTKSKLWYGRQACQRHFETSDKVRVLLLTPGHPIQAKFHGP